MMISHQVHRICITLICIFVMTGAITSCSIGSGDDREINDIDVHKGTDGLVMEFTEGSPPEMVLEDEAFSAAVRLHNKGAADITNGYLNFITESDYMSVKEIEGASTVTTSRGTFSVEGKSKTNPEGAKKLLQMHLQAEGLTGMEETHTVHLSTHACYRYSTTFAEPICLDPDKGELEEKKKSCEMSQMSYAGQGAPVAVTLVKPDFRGGSSGKKPVFTISVENSGDGEVLNSSVLREACSSSSLDDDDFGVIRIDTAYLSDEPLTCDPGVLTLREGTAKTRCRAQNPIEGGRDAFTTILRLELDYGYTETLSERIEIRTNPR